MKSLMYDDILKRPSRSKSAKAVALTINGRGMIKTLKMNVFALHQIPSFLEKKKFPAKLRRLTGLAPSRMI